MVVKKPLFRLNQLLDRFLRNVACFVECIDGGGMNDAVVDMTLGDCGRCCIVVCSPYDELGGGMLKEVRELLKDWRKLVRLNSRRTPPGRRPGDI